MTEKTLTPKNKGAKKKSGEITRFLQLLEFKNIQPIDIANICGVSERTIKNCIYDDLPLGGKLLRSIHLELGVSIDWLISGDGHMMCTENSVKSAAPGTEDERLARIVAALDDWALHANDAEIAWLEIDTLQRLKNNWPPLGKL